MSRFVALLLSAAVVRSVAFVAPNAPNTAVHLSGASQMRAEMPRAEAEAEATSPVGAVMLASLVGLMVGLASPQMAMAEDAPAAPAPVDKKAKMKDEMAKAQAALQANAKSKQDRLKEQIQQLKDLEKTADLTYATK
ncbi:unnamed protein product [Effrenium voratum]|uniref:Uncharacterized protein n=1 Tax=Effrenium voratum TaxID=2562239 RepID=A0AA36MM69_9DINO|nr:unnamed protein product [Effrenium voratum]CAJ1377087.1 unnamed protein product [Effrenium voratum]CAJ1431496.1 unnamed protein product [Effrenium voratum]CAJ1431497.1 unnamed protein product [Effrenium voratum]CAJ1431498.1 unnamed protein product [Effrenium voratum]|mmetsp:Transcript_121816/g.289642  ORF Transcript_121816/g.289642 Transcript_121816/m.289642 type:complete len:137 (-) Transcript_121816:98-508(-)